MSSQTSTRTPGPARLRAVVAAMAVCSRNMSVTVAPEVAMCALVAGDWPRLHTSSQPRWMVARPGPCPATTCRTSSRTSARTSPPGSTHTGRMQLG